MRWFLRQAAEGSEKKFRLLVAAAFAFDVLFYGVELICVQLARVVRTYPYTPHTANAGGFIRLIGSGLQNGAGGTVQRAYAAFDTLCSAVRNKRKGVIGTVAWITLYCNG